MKPSETKKEASIHQDDELRLKQSKTLIQATILQANKADAANPYLIKKDITADFLAKNPVHTINPVSLDQVFKACEQAHGAVPDDMAAMLKRSQGNIMIPLFKSGVGDDFNEVSSCQMIMKTGQKAFMSGGQVKGSYAVVGGQTINTAKNILLAEGFATAVSLHEATKQPVFIAFSATNLKPVLENMMKQWPDKTVVICADNDQSLTGIKAANDAIKHARNNLDLTDEQKYGLSVIYPSFSQEKIDNFQKETNSKAVPTDFNDLAKLHGSPLALKGLIEKHIEDENAKKLFWLDRKLI